MDLYNFLTLFIFLLRSHSLQAGNKYEYQLVNDLLQNYSKLVRPTDDHRLATKVLFSMSLRQIMDLDVKNQIISIYGWLIMTWNDTSLSWDPNQYNNITEIRLPSDLVWKPDILLKNSVEKTVISGGTENIRIQYDGQIAWVPDNLFRAYCQINVKYFPFDSQNCSLAFMSASYFLYQLELEIDQDPSLAFYQNNTQFDIISMSVKKKTICCPIPSCDVTFYIYIKRKPLYYILNMVLPCIVTVAVSFLAFLVPNESGEKMSISITSLLSIIVLLLVISGEFPPISDYVPLISIFYAAATLFVATISLASVFILNIHHYGEHGKDVPKLVQKIFFSNFGRVLMFPVKVDFDSIKTINENPNLSESSTSIKKSKSLCCSSCKILCQKQIKVTPVEPSKKFENETEAEDIYKKQWLTLANMLDRFALYILLFAVVISFIVILSSGAN